MTAEDRANITADHSSKAADSGVPSIATGAISSDGDAPQDRSTLTMLPLCVDRS
ncbi:MAG: hypothetical protein WBG35_12725 [Acidobacteriaceae bacterium]